MHILLVNSNPVVSRLMALCVHNKEILLDEVRGVTALDRREYDIVFIDEACYANEVLVIDRYVEATKKILFASEGSSEVGLFDMVIQKPFLPSQITELFENVQGIGVESEPEVKRGFIFPLSTESPLEEENQSQAQVLDMGEIDKINTLLDSEKKSQPTESNSDEIEQIVVDAPEDAKEQSEPAKAQESSSPSSDEVEKMALDAVEDSAEESEDRELSDDEIEALIKESLIADGLEIVNEDEIYEEIYVEEKRENPKTEKMEALKKELEDLDDDSIFNGLDSSQSVEIFDISDEIDLAELEDERVQESVSIEDLDKDSAMRDFTHEEYSMIRDAVQKAVESMKRKKIKKLLRGKKVKVAIEIEERA